MKIVFLATAAAALLTPMAHAAPACTKTDLQWTMNTEGFAGMSHNGALMILRNRSPHVCTVPRRPQLVFTDAADKPVDVRLSIPRGMHPGPVLTPVVLQPGQAAQGKLQWVMGPVYDHSTCVHTAHVAFTPAVGGKAIQVNLRADICGPAGHPPTYQQEWLQPADTPAAAR